MNRSGVFMAPVYDGKVEPISLEDEHGEMLIFMLPFVKPSYVERYYPNEVIESFTDAIRVAIQNMAVDQEKRNVLITHQFVTGASHCDSEDVSLGGSDNVDVSAFATFDYVALGHIHGPQCIGCGTVRYCGTPLKYSFSESHHSKSVTVVELAEKGKITVRTVPLVPKHDMQEIKGKYEEITLKSYYENTTFRSDYMHITLTDEEDIPDAIGKLRTIYTNIMKLDYDNKRTRSGTVIASADAVEQKTPLELFGEFYEKQNNQPMTEQQQAFTASQIEKIWEGER
jgi:exonuclease SbcD